MANEKLLEESMSVLRAMSMAQQQAWLAKAKKEKRIAAFLAELTALTVKHKLQIRGCGCCGSPYITEVDVNHDLLQDMGYGLDNEGEHLSFGPIPKAKGE